MDETPAEKLQKYKLALEEEWEANKNTTETQGELFLREHAIDAARALVDTMQTTDSDRVRVSTAKYILDRTVFDKGAADEDITDVMKKILGSAGSSNPE